jgi:hypothetical protein
MQVDSFALPREMQERSDPPLRLAIVNARQFGDATMALDVSDCR